jgi:hypothetical protein
MSDEVDKVLSKAPILVGAFGRLLAFIVVLYALRAQRPRTGTVSLFAALGAIMAAWVKPWT